MRLWLRFFGAACVLSMLAAPASAGKKRPDSGLYTYYQINWGQWVDFSVCGTFRDTYGCYGGQQMSNTMEQPCAILEGPVSYKDNTVQRDFYVLDKRTAEGAEAQLYVFRRTDTITGDTYSVSAHYVITVALGVPGGASANCSLAGNKGFAYAATNHSQQAAQIDRKSFSVTAVGGGFTPAQYIEAITADDRGYIAIRSANTTFGGTHFFDPNGKWLGSWGAASDISGFHSGGALQ
jgi:hypothetical protein